MPTLGSNIIATCTRHSAEWLLQEHSLQTICQTGIYLIVALRHRANRLQTHLNRSPGSQRALPALVQKVLSGLLQPHARFLSELGRPNRLGLPGIF